MNKQPKKQNQGFTHLEIIAAIVVVGLLVVIGILFWNARKNAKPAEKADTSQTTKPEASGHEHESAPLTSYTNENYGVALSIPEDWKQSETDQSAMLTAEDTENNISFRMFFTKNNNSGLSCQEIVKDSQDLTYTNPLPGQRSITKLTFASISPYSASGKNTLCSIMITGSYSAKAGTHVDTKSEAFQKELPTNRIVVEVSNIDVTTNFPELSKALGSYRYHEVIEALETLQVK